MGRPRVKHDLPKYASAFIDNRGKQRIRLRRKGWQTLYVTADLGTAEFTREYHDWLDNGQVVPGEGRVIPQSFDDLISRFYKTARFQKLRPTTQRTYRGELERFRDKYGNRSAATMKARHVQTLIDQMAETPAAANNLRKRLGQLFDVAILADWRTDNPAKAVQSVKTRKGGFRTWQEPEIALYEAKHPIGTMPRLALDLALYTAQRRSDLAVMGPRDVEGDEIRVRQLKTGRELYIPIHPALQESIEATPHGETFITSERGKPFVKESLGEWFRKHRRAAGIAEGYSLHGLRKAASRRMAEMGLSNQVIKSITGHVTDSEVSRYTRDAEQRKMARRGVESMASKQK